jgi:hypothetical protein
MLPTDPKRVRRPRNVWGAPPESQYLPITWAVFDESFVDEGDAPAQRWKLDVLCSRCVGSMMQDHGPSEGWLSLKLYATSQVRLKANYWLGWSPTAGRFAFRGDHSALRALRPDLYDAVALVLTGVCAKFGVTAGQYARAKYVIGGVDQKVLCPYRGVITIGRRMRDGGSCAYALIQSEGLSMTHLRASDLGPRVTDETGSIDDLL